MRKYVKVDGGIGRCIAATGVLKGMKEIAVITSFPWVFDGIIDRVYPLGMPYLFEDHIRHGEFLEPEPYNLREYYADQLHITEVFNKELTGESKFVQPEIVLSPSEVAHADEYIKSLRGKNNKKIMLLQPYAAMGGTKIPDETYRSIDSDTISAIIDAYKDTHCILLVKGQVQAKWSDTIELTPPDIRKVFAVIPFADSAICCDSFLHHAIAALGTPCTTVVLWGGTSEKNLGYKEHTNLKTMEVECEPNRVPHNHSYYVNKNKGCNNFLPLMDKIKETINGSVDTNSTRQQGGEGSSDSAHEISESCGNGCRDCSTVHPVAA